jgi:hypothetical protein
MTGTKLQTITNLDKTLWIFERYFRLPWGKKNVSTRTPLKPGVNSDAPEQLSSTQFCFTCDV